MKAPLFDYRKMEGGKPLHTTLDVPPDLEGRFDLFRKNDWAIGLFREDDQPAGHFYVAVMDSMTDVILTRWAVAGEEEIPAGIRHVCAVDPPVLDAAAKNSIEYAPGPEPKDTSEEI